MGVTGDSGASQLQTDSSCRVFVRVQPGTVDTNREGVGGGFKELDEAELEDARRRRAAFEDDDNEM